MILDFKQVELSDREQMAPFLERNRYQSCDFSFANIYMWRKKYDTRYRVVENHLVLRGKGGFFLMPLGEGDLRPTLEAMIADDKERGKEFRLLAITPKMREELETAMPGAFEFESDRDNSDYLYLGERLRTLSGKKLHSKRNHINKFNAMYQSEFELIDDHNMDEVIAMHGEWCKINGCAEDDSLLEESCAVRDALNHYQQLGLRGGALRANGRVVAFSMGQPLNDTTFDVIMEKAFTDVNGAYTVINQLFAQNVAADYEYLNREEDLGLEGLRKAKTSYYPDILLDKGSAVLKG